MEIEKLTEPNRDIGSKPCENFAWNVGDISKYCGKNKWYYGSLASHLGKQS